MQQLLLHGKDEDVARAMRARQNNIRLSPKLHAYVLKRNSQLNREPG